MQIGGAASEVRRQEQASDDGGGSAANRVDVATDRYIEVIDRFGEALDYRRGWQKITASKLGIGRAMLVKIRAWERPVTSAQCAIAVDRLRLPNAYFADATIDQITRSDAARLLAHGPLSVVKREDDENEHDEQDDEREAARAAAPEQERFDTRGVLRDGTPHIGALALIFAARLCADVHDSISIKGLRVLALGGPWPGIVASFVEACAFEPIQVAAAFVDGVPALATQPRTKVLARAMWHLWDTRDRAGAMRILEEGGMREQPGIEFPPDRTVIASLASLMEENTKEHLTWYLAHEIVADIAMVFEGDERGLDDFARAVLEQLAIENAGIRR